jgi:hypothetical protein
MAASINASLTAGVVTTADTSGNLNLQSGGTTIVALTSTGAAVTGTLSASGAATLASVNFGGSTLSQYAESQAWTPNQGSGLTVVGAFSSSGTYTRVGNMITANGYVAGATSVAVTAVGDICSNLPVGAGGTTIFFGGAANNAFSVFSQTATSTARLLSTSAISATTRIYFSITYTV